MTDPDSGRLTALLFEHPLPAQAALLHTVDSHITVARAREEAVEFEEQLRSAGVSSGEAVVVRLPNSPRFVTAMFGIWSAGAVLVPAGTRQARSELEHVLDVTQPAAVLSESGLSRASDSPARFEPETAFVTWTSGTTGSPKAILHTHGAYLELLDRVLGPLRPRPADRSRPPSPNLVPVPLALNAGIYNVLFGLRAGAPLVIMDHFETTQFAELVRRHGIRSTVLPPAALVMLCDDEAVSDLGPLKYVRSITAPLSPLAARRFAEKFKVTVLNGYGQAEIGEVIGWTAADARAHPQKLGAAGRAHPEVEIKVVDSSGSALGTDEVGELVVRPPRMASGYAGGESLEDRLDEEGYVRTGDLARIDDEGFVWIEGRASEVINRGGNKVFPGQVEEVLLLSPRITEAAVVGVPDRRLGEVPVAFVVGDADEQGLEALCREHLSPYKVPVSYLSVEELPRSEVGKVLRRDLADLYEERFRSGH